MKYINLVSGPRNISTALMYSFAQRKNAKVLDEPFYAYYLFETGIEHPGREEVLASQPLDKEEVIARIFQSPGEGEMFLKNMSKHLEVAGSFPFEKCLNIFLIRNPRQIIASFAQVIETPNMHDIGLEYQYKLFELLRKKQKTVVIDSGLVLHDPESVLKKVCRELDIDFQPAMLHWSSGPKPYDGVWAPYWYANVHQSTGFTQQPSSERPLPPHLESLFQEADTFYKKLLPFAVQP